MRVGGIKGNALLTKKYEYILIPLYKSAVHSHLQHYSKFQAYIQQSHVYLYGTIQVNQRDGNGWME